MKKRLITKIIFTILILNIGITLYSTSVSASNATDYNFTDELDEDRVGIGFTWTAENRTLKITGIKNSYAMIKLPENSIIDIQGDSVNTIAGVYCKGNLLIKGNDSASLNITSCNCSTLIGYSSCISVNDTLTIESGNIKIISDGVGYSMSQPTYTGVFAKNLIINNGKFEINIGRITL